MVKTFYLMRHGQTRFNVQGRIQGACDSPLTDEGIEQAKAARRYFEQEGISFTRVYSSTQERACDTAELATGRVDYIRLKGIKEMDFGAYEAHQEYLNPPAPKKRPANCAIFKITYDGKEMCVQSIYNPSMQEYIFERD